MSTTEMHHVPLLIFAGALLACLASAQAQQPLYRSVGPDGRVTFTDRVPAEPRAATRPVAGGGGTAPATALPYELREAASRYPVTLYTGNGCAPCDSARGLLTARGIPFTERTITSNEDIEALRNLSGGQSLPFGTVGSQHLKGFSDSEWTRYLDAAAYPKQSQLPAGWVRSEPAPLVAVKTAEAAPAPSPKPAATAVDRSMPPAPRPAAQDNPAGIRF